jgi:hypothetical protein
MKDRPKYQDLPAEGLETPYGRLYPPQSQGKQILTLVAAVPGERGLAEPLSAMAEVRFRRTF